MYEFINIKKKPLYFEEIMRYTSLINKKSANQRELVSTRKNLYQLRRLYQQIGKMSRMV